ELLGRRRQPNEVERDSTQQGGLVGWLRRLETLCFELGQNEGVDRAADPGRALDGRRLVTGHLLQGPAFPFLGRQRVLLRAARDRLRRRLTQRQRGAERRKGQETGITDADLRCHCPTLVKAIVESAAPGCQAACKTYLV